MAIRRDQSHNRRANHFVGRISEDALCPNIPTGDDTIQIFSDDRIVGRSNDGRELTRSDFGQMAIGHIAVAPYTPCAFSFQCQDFGITLKDSPILQLQYVEALLTGGDDFLNASEKP